MKIGQISTLAAAAAAMLSAAPAMAQNYDFDIYNHAVGADPVEQPAPSYPSGQRRGQEGWVSVNYVITAEGRAIEPVMLDSVGGGGFEQAVRDAVPQWRFEPPGEELSNNTSNIRFEIHDGRDMATPNFLKRYQSILQHLHYEENEAAREAVDATIDRGGWNLYEATMLWLMVGRVDGAQGNSAGKLENYRRALGVSNRNSLDDDDLRDLLAKVFVLEIELGHYAAASGTIERLRRLAGSEKELAGLTAEVATLERRLAGREPITARATLFNPSDSEAGQPLWNYVPARRTFSFAALDGNVERFEVRCERDRLEGSVEPGRTWSLPDNPGNCRVLVFGDDGASFDFIEHSEAETPDATGTNAVARSDVLDRRNRR